jgi:hypothetical protein
MGFGMTQAQGDIALNLNAASATETSGPIAPAGQAAYVLALTQVSAITGTGANVTVSLEESDNGSTGWTAVTGATTAAITAAGSAMCFGVPAKNHVRVRAVIAGTTPAVTAKVAVLVFSE